VSEKEMKSLSEAAAKGEKLNWEEIPIGGMVLEAGCGEKYRTGDWRSDRPIWNEKKCTHCLTCWVFCPDGGNVTSDGKMTGIDLYHCKGCGICAKACPFDAIAMVLEERALAEEAAAAGKES
jgi:pyruvate ferredoxin oxidoreductase delta subunit